MKFTKTDIVLAIAVVVLIALAILFDPSFANASPLDWSKEKDIVKVIGPIDSSILSEAAKIEKQAGSPVIRILINSPGGAVVTGQIFVQAMELAKARGSKIECAVSNIAASMAFHVLAHCDSRYLLRYSMLLFHPVRVEFQGALTPEDLRRMYANMTILTMELDEDLRLALGKGDYEKFNQWETLWTPHTLLMNFPEFSFSIVTDIKIPKEVDEGLFAPMGKPLWETEFDRLVPQLDLTY